MRSSFPDGCFRNHHPRDLVVAWFPSCLVLFSVSDLRVTTVSPPASFDASTTNFVRFPIVMTPLLSLICLQDITPHLFLSETYVPYIPGRPSHYTCRSRCFGLACRFAA